MQLILAILPFATLIASSCCVRIPLFATLRDLQHQIDELKTQVDHLLSIKCDLSEQQKEVKGQAAVTTHYASCRLTKSGSSEEVGRVDLKEKSDTGKLQIALKVDGSKIELQPNSAHGFHVHKYGNISGSCGTTGGHYNPDNVDHAGPSNTTRHVGDLGNVMVDGSGDINVHFNDTYASLVGDKAIIGRAFVLHAGQDDLGRGGNEGSRTTGNAGARLACCVIGWASGVGWTD